MASLGWYIHYKRENYEKWGVAPPDIGTKKLSTMGIYQKQKEELIQKIERRGKQKGIKDLEDALTAIIYPITDADFAGHNRMQQYLETTISDMLLKWSVDWMQGLSVQGSRSKDSYKFGESKGFSLAKIHELKVKIESIFNSLVSAKALDEKTETQLNTLYNIVNQIIAATSRVSKDFVSYKNLSANTRNSLKPLIADLNTYLEQLTSVAYADAIGSTFEHAIATLDDRLSATVDATSIELIKNELVTGKERSNVAISGFDKYMGELSGSIAGGKKKQAEETHGDLVVTVEDESTPKDLKVVYKADVALQYNNEEYLISAKNYKLAAGSTVSLVSETPLLFALMKNANNSFINHALNAMLTVPIVQNLEWEMANDAIRFTLITEALSGISQGYGTGAADTLIINNRSNREVKVISIQDLVPKAANDPKYQWYNINKYDLDNQPVGVEKDNKYNIYIDASKKGLEGKAAWNLGKRRIDKMLAELHATKIKVTLDYKKAFATKS